MKSYLVDVKLGDDVAHVVSGKRVTVPEIALLRAIHGSGAVFDIRAPQEVTGYVEDEERLRLTSIYDTRAETDGSLMERLFGLHARLPVTLRDIGIDANATAKEAKRVAEAAIKRASELEGEAKAEAKAAKTANPDEAFS